MKSAPSSNGSVQMSALNQKASTMSMMMPLRSESFAYPKAGSSDIMAQIQFYGRQHGQKILATLSFLVFILFISSDYVHDGSGLGNLRRNSRYGASFGGAAHRGYFRVEDSIKPNSKFTFAAITDLDELSKEKEARKPTWDSFMLLGDIQWVNGKYALTMEPKMRTLKTKHNEAGRGAEFSELTIYHNRLLTFDDRTGDVFEVLNTPNGDDSFVVPRFVITEGSGDTDKGMKWEWSTVKDDLLYMGSMGKEYTNPDGSIANTNNLWVATLSAEGVLSRIDWAKNYNVVRKALGAESPGYVIHEAINWSDHLKKWVFLPRRISSEAYDENKDEKNGSNKLVLVSEDFSSAKVVEINMADKDGLHGFSSFAFVPNTKDRHALALRSVEEDCVGGDDQVCKQRSYIVVFDVMTGEVLLDEVKIEANMKFEGVEFMDPHITPPAY
ncbi:Soluble calcium-activated nucleotidase 1 [Seminavis robusta]|uniref:Soluble calcium-activated nucleotidase 1 n=1 Tax=Seminavis robusta TaxID=568900 RepID=A0A9N8H2A4_9STRA|nr:Soluble calcium-activated nucleotidase 1 [Seminavis robusta]|eukprot:Sro6_g004960.1 Soluble calcium-activated nucleotidase 1 (441) ;mRNA; f:60559-62126